MLDDRIARRTVARLAAVHRALGRRSLVRPLPRAGRLLDDLRAALFRIPPEDRTRILNGPDLRGFLGEAEIWIVVLRLASRRSARAAGRRPGGPAGYPADARLVRLFDRVSRTEHLATLLPSGRIDRGFPARAARFAIRRLRDALDDLAAVVLGLRLAYPGGPPLSVRLRFREDAEQARPAVRIDLGTFPAPAGPLTLVATGRGGRPATLWAHLERGALLLRGPRYGEIIVPAAGSRFRCPDLPPAPAVQPPALRPPAVHRRAIRRPAPPVVLARRDLIPGTSILLAPSLDSGPRRILVRREIPGLGRRLARALRIVRAAWPEGHRELLARTLMVVPVRERRLVSYSLASRPGISFINVAGKPAIVLADDLLHEAAHHRLHAIQDLDRLLTPGPETDEAQSFHSPWRRAKRPLHGLLHGAYTFLDRADLFLRVLAAARARPHRLTPLLRPHGPAWVRRELRREIALLGAALADLGRATRAGLLTAAGRALLQEMRARARRLRRGEAGRSRRPRPRNPR